MRKTITWTALLAGALFVAACGGATSPNTPAPPDMDDAQPVPRGDQDSKDQEYTDVIGEDAVSDEGLFTVHEVDGDYFFEIPDSLLDRDMMLISDSGAGGGEIGRRRRLRGYAI